MADRPLLILPHSAPLPRILRKTMVVSHLKLPRREEQGAMIGPRITSMLDAFVANTPTGTSSENILVLETIERSDNFRTAVAAIPGLKWLAEIDMDDIAVDARFFERPKIGSRFFKDRVFAFDARDSRDVVAALAANGVIDTDGYLLENSTSDAIRAAVPEEYREYADEIVGAIDAEKNTPLPGRMYLSLSNRQALSEIKTLFDIWERGGRLRHGAGAWGEIFSHLRAIRFWDVEDRVSDTGILDYWQKEVECKRGTASTVAFEIEFSYEDNPANRRQRQQHVEGLALAEGGTVIVSCDLPQIHFQAIKIEVPVANIERVLGGDYSALYRDSGILFFRPSPQCAVESYSDGDLEDLPPTAAAPDAPPIIALLDGLPFARHNLLDGYVIIDDPDDYAASYQPKEFNHGTAMLSLICRGELDASESPVTRKVYVRPILRPDEESGLDRRPERVPKDVFFEDLV